MLRKVLIIIALATISFFHFGGCGETSSDAEPNEEVVKTMAEYEAEAEAQINEENMAEELEMIEKAMEQEISEEL